MQIPNVNRSIFSSSHPIMPLWPSNFVYSRPYSNNLFFFLTSTIQRYIHCISMANGYTFIVHDSNHGDYFCMPTADVTWIQHHVFFSYLCTKYAGWITFHGDINFSSESKHFIEICTDCDAIQFSCFNSFNLDFILLTSNISNQTDFFFYKFHRNLIWRKRLNLKDLLHPFNCRYEFRNIHGILTFLSLYNHLLFGRHYLQCTPIYG